MNVIVFAKRESDRLEWISEDIRDEYHPDILEMSVSARSILSRRNKLAVCDTVVLVEPGLLDVTAVYLFSGVKDVVVVDSSYRWFKTRGDKWAALKYEVHKELRFQQILLKSRVFYKSIYWKVMLPLRELLSNISKIKILY
ncbi:MAG: hypothetical protein SWQ30_05195 [Thermodesulfobacteriota bacterium]|nr:hypothetical protein [Thermodesulfobacteriota bacterium]